MAPVTAAISAFSPVDAQYPQRLLQLPRPPRTLWVSGRTPGQTERGVAMVGSRAASLKGCALATEMAAALGRAGWFVVSGGALGIDAASHAGALQVAAPTFAVLGCGVDVVYPDRHAGLFAQIAGSGGLLSEHGPGTPPRFRQFPSRNRLVAALAEVVVVIEARLRSGALITAGLARKLGRLLLAVPGSAGTDQLIASGAAEAIEDPHELLRRLSGGPARVIAVPPALAPLVRLLSSGAESPAGLARKLGWPLAEVMAALFEAELSGWVRRISGGSYEVPHAN